MRRRAEHQELAKALGSAVDSATGDSGWCLTRISADTRCITVAGSTWRSDQ